VESTLKAARQRVEEMRRKGVEEKKRKVVEEEMRRKKEKKGTRSRHLPLTSITIPGYRNIVLRTGRIRPIRLRGLNNKMRRHRVQSTHVLLEGLHEESVVVERVGLEDAHLRLIVVLPPTSSATSRPPPYDRSFNLPCLVPVYRGRVRLFGRRSAVVPGPSSGHGAGPS